MPRLPSFAIALTLLAAAFLTQGVLPIHAAEPGKFWVYIGTYTGPENAGIHLAEFDAATGALTAKGLAAKVVNPSFVAIHPSRKFLYAVSEVATGEGKKTGAVTAFAVDAKTGTLTALNHQSSEGAGPCHLVVDASGKAVLVANYGAGSIASLPIGEDGKLGPAASAIQHKGKNANPNRQEGPHAHSINLDPSGKFAVVADLGLDEVLVYKFDAAKATLVPNVPPAAKVASGAGPRHFAFHPNGNFGYVINEMGNTVTAFAFDAAKGTLTTIQDVSTLPKDFKGSSFTAEVVMHPSGKFLYGSNRGHDSLAIFQIDSASGKLTPVGIEPTGGKTPRNFAIDPTGAFVLAENQGSNSIVVFKIDQTTGALKATGHTLMVPSPVCVRMIPQ